MTTAARDDKMTYQEIVDRHRPAVPLFRNVVRAFLIGGGICIIGQVAQTLFVRYGHFSLTAAGNPTVAVMVFLSVLATALGVYDRFAQWAGAGSAVPVTGFANTMASAAMEYRSEGWVAGIGGNMFKLAGPVIVYGVVSAFVVAIIRYALTQSAT